MLFQPSKTKHRKAHKGRIYGNSSRCNKLSFGSFGIKTLERSRLTAEQIESARRAITHFMKRSGRVWIRVFPNVPVSKKPAEVRMGKGKGSVEFWVARVRPGRILFEVGGVPRSVAEGAFAKANSKLPVKTRVVIREF